MIVVNDIDAMRQWREVAGRQVVPSAGGVASRLVEDVEIGLVPTMGYLHEGHLSLIEASKAENGFTVASVFVNPSQFGAGDDLAAYPRDLDRDTKMLEAAGCDVVFAPRPEEMYPPGFQTWVETEHVSLPLEGAHRPGHFRGVCTVVLKLMHLVRPRRAYFGEKDAQQLAVIRRMVLDLNVPCEVVGRPTVREPDGLAMSSRNVYLKGADRRAATVLFRALKAGEKLIDEGERDAEWVREAMREVLGTERLATTEYVSVADPETLDELTRLKDRALLSMAVRVGPARLIDNLRVTIDG